MNRYKIDTVPHIICGGFTKGETEGALIDLHFLGIDNVLVLRGDAVKNERSFVPEPGGNAYAIDLVKQVVHMNAGKYLHEEEEIEVAPTNFCIGVAGYPEKHFESPNMTSDLRHLKAKVDAGAEYVVTQMFFDNQKYFDFVKKCREAGITIPIIPGLKVLTQKAHASLLPKTFFLELPRIMPTFTFVPPLPRSLPKTSLFLILMPAAGLPSIFTILSPARIPSSSDGPPEITDITRMVSLMMLNSIPIP